MNNNSKIWVRDVFDRAAPSYGEKGCQYFDEFGKQLVALAKLNSGEKILDVATGKGAILYPALQIIGKTGTAVGIDLSPVMIEEAQKRNPLSSAQFLVMDAEKLSFSSNYFDVVFCGFALFFFSNLSKALNEFKRVLKPGGRVAISIWGRPSSLGQWIFNRAEELGAKQQLKMQIIDSATTLKQALSKAEFHRIQIEEKEQIFWHANSEEWWNSLWSHGPRSRLEQLQPSCLDILRREALNHVEKISQNERVEETMNPIFAVAEN